MSGVVVGGVDTHSQTYHAAVIDHLGWEISDCESRRPWRAMRPQLGGCGGSVSRPGRSGRTRSYGAGLAGHLRQGVGGGGRPPGRRAGSPRKANPTRLALMPLRGLHLFDGVPTGRSYAAWSQFDHITMNIYAHVLDESTRRLAAR